MRGWSDALPPAFMRGVIPVRTLVSGGVRITGHKSINLSFRTSPQTGVGISNVQQAAKQLECHSEPVRTLVWESPSSSRLRPPNDGDCHTSDIGHWFAMTRNSLARDDREFGRGNAVGTHLCIRQSGISSRNCKKICPPVLPAGSPYRVPYFSRIMGRFSACRSFSPIHWAASTGVSSRCSPEAISLTEHLPWAISSSPSSTAKGTPSLLA